VILTYDYWKRKFGGDPSAIGRNLMVNGRSRQIIGVMPDRFQFLDLKFALILPQRFDRNKVVLGNFSYQGIARLRPGVTQAQAGADVARMLPLANRMFPPPPGFSVRIFEEARIAPDLHPLKQDVTGDVGNVLWVLMGTIGMVLLIACANVANLLLVRAEGRQQELAIRAALGAGWAQIARELLFESLLLGLMGGALGLGVAYAALQVLVAVAPAGLPRIGEIAIDSSALLFTLAVSLLSGLLFGFLPVLKYAGPHVAMALRSGGRSISHSRERHRARSALVIVQVSLALVLLISSGLMIRTFQALRRVEPGFVRPEQIQTLRIAIPEAQVKEPEQVMRMQGEILRRISAIPGVASAAVTRSVPMDGENSTDLLYAEDRVYSEGQMPPLRRFKFIAPGYFHTIGAPLLAGRDLTWEDIYGMRPVAVVSANLAREQWGNPGAAIGKRIRENPKNPWTEVVGVVGDIRDDGVTKKAPTIVYWPVMMKQFWTENLFVTRSVAFAVRSGRTGSDSFLKEIREAVWAVNPNLPLAQVRTLEEIYNKSMARTSFTLVMLGIAGGMALLLGVVGIYGVISYSVSQRTREIGIRMALGAEQQELKQMFVRHALILAGIGVAFGLCAAAGLMRLMSSLLFEVSPMDPATYGAVSAVLIAAATVASYVPARKATAVDPVEALRAE
jgi:predicted permease